MSLRSFSVKLKKAFGRFISSTSDVNSLNKYENISNTEHISQNDINNFSKYVTFYKSKNVHFTFYGILHNNIYEKSCSGSDCVQMMKNKKFDYVLLELCKNRLNNITQQLLKDDMKFEKKYSKFSYLPRIHNGFLQNEFLPIIKYCKKENIKIFPCDRSTENVKNRLDSKLLYDTKAYRRFFTYCIESISLRHYSVDQFLRLYSDYNTHKEEGKNETEMESNLGRETEKREKENGTEKEKEQEREGMEHIEETNRNLRRQNVKYNSTWEDIECLKKLDLLKILNERLKILSKPSYDILITEKCKYISQEIVGFLLNNESELLEKNSEHSKNILIVCSANIMYILKEELHSSFVDLEKKMNMLESSFVFENAYNSYNEYIKPHWPLIIIKYYIIPYILLYFLLNIMYGVFSLIYQANFQTNMSCSPKTIEVKV